MSLPEPASALAAEDVPPGLVAVGVYGTAQEGFEHGLVVLAAGHPYWLVPDGEKHRLLVEPNAADLALAQLARFDRESQRWPPPPIVDPWLRRRLDLITPLLWAAAMLAIFQWSQTRPALIELGALDTQAVFERGEAWRAATALFLHGSAAHVISNALNGILVFAAVLTTIGRARGWVLLAGSAVLGNLAVAAVNYPGPYRSLGASTAIFAGVGLLTGRALRVVAGSRHPHRWRAMFAPLAAGLTVLALYGAGEMRVDVGAHFTGFVAGVALGFGAALPRDSTSRLRPETASRDQGRP